MPSSSENTSSQSSPGNCGARSVALATSELRRWVERLPRPIRLIFLMHFGDGLSVREIGILLDVAYEVVDRELDRMKQAARELLLLDQVSDGYELDEAARAVRDRWRHDEPVVDESRLFTTHEVAAICGVSPRTACAWCDRGLLTSHRLPTTGPQSGHRRVARPDLVAFMQRHDIPSRRRDLLST